MKARILRFSRRPKPRAGEVDLPYQDRFDSEEEVHQKPMRAKLVWRILSYLKPYRPQLTLIILLIVGSTLLSSTAGVLLLRMTTKYARLGDVPHTFWFALAMVAFGGGFCLLEAISDRLSSRLGQTVVHDLRMAIFNHLQRLSISFFDRTKQGYLISRMTSDIGTMEQIYAWAIPAVVWSVLQVFIVMIYMLWLNWRLFLIVSFVAPALALTTWIFEPWVIQAWRELRLRVSRLTANLAENIQGIRVVQAFTREADNLRTFDELGRRHYAARMRAIVRFNLYFGIVGLIGALGSAAVYFYAGVHGPASAANVALADSFTILSFVMPSLRSVADYYRQLPAPMTPEDILAFIAALGMFFGPIRQLGDLYNQALSAMAGGERIFGLLDTQPDVQDRPDAQPIPPIRGDVVFDHVDFAYNPDKLILHDINISARPGETVALVGPTGAGKSSTINLLCRFYDATAGRVLIDGRDVRDVTLHSLHAQMGIVLQDAFLFSGTVMDNIRFARPDATDDEVINAAKIIGAHDVIANLRNGYQTEVSERGESLSAGERQLVCFTRAMVANPRILVLDEATSSVDSATEHRIQVALERLIERRTTFVVAHRLSTVRHANQVLVIEDGRVVERGTHDELLTKGGTYTRMYKEFLRAE